jgi:hypothetical protein
MRRPSSHLPALAALLALAPLSACTCSTEAPVEETVTIDQLTLTVTPTGEAVDGVWVVAPRSTLTLYWGVSGDAGRVVLAAGERTLFSGDGAGGGSFTDDCAVEGAACLTAEEGTILFTLTVLGKGEDVTSATESLQVEVRVPPAPLAIESFTADDAELTTGESTMLRLSVTGASGLALEEASCDGDATRELAANTAELAIAPRCTTAYRLKALTGEPPTEGARAELLVVVNPTATLESSASQVIAGGEVELTFASEGARFVELTFDGAPVDVSGLNVAADSVTVTVPADAAVGERLVASLVAFDLDTPVAGDRWESEPATIELEVVAP